MMMTLYHFLSGAAVFGFFICGLLFLRFWRRTGDQLFLAFALAFPLLGTGQALLVLADMPTEEAEPIYLLRLVAFGIIILSILRKNKRTT